MFLFKSFWYWILLVLLNILTGVVAMQRTKVSLSYIAILTILLVVAYQPTTQSQNTEKPSLSDKNAKPATSAPAPSTALDSYRAFKNPEHVVIRGYSENALHPFVSRDGKYLFFSIDISGKKDIHYAVRNDDGTFNYKKELTNVNTTAIEISPTSDKNDQFYFVRNDKNISRIYQGDFSLKNGGSILNLIAMNEIVAKPDSEYNDVEISNDGKEVLYTEVIKNNKGQVIESNIVVALKKGDKFQPSADETQRLMRQINKRLEDWNLKYGATLSTDELELFFTAAKKDGNPVIYQSIRSGPNKPFGIPLPVVTIEGYAEHPCLSPDGLTLYFHRKEGKLYRLYRTVRDKRELPGFKAGAKDTRSLPITDR
jgi:hypothetical protein